MRRTVIIEMSKLHLTLSEISSVINYGIFSLVCKKDIMKFYRTLSC